MIRDQFLLDIAPELIVDNFAGGGGASCGIELALGRHVDIAINHDPEAVAMHSMNHPQTEHHCESVWDVDPIKVTRGRPVGLAWFSPDCKHFSKAKGGTPVSRDIRGLAWVELRWALLVRPRVMILENVEEFTTWGPLIEVAPGRWKPDPERKGETFNGLVSMLSTGISPDHPAFAEACEFLNLAHDSPLARELLDGLRYTVEYRQLRGRDYGTPTIRKRLFKVSRCDGNPIVWPAPSHGPRDSAAVKAKALKPYRTAAECIDFSLEADSIFGRPRPLVPNTLRRVAKGLWRHVLANPKPYIVESQSGPSVLTPFLNEHANASSQRTMAADEPIATLCAHVKGGHFSVVAPMLAPLRGTSEAHLGGHSALDPVSTISAGGTHHAMVAAHLTKFRTESAGSDLVDPMPTVTSNSFIKRPGGSPPMGIVGAHLVTVGYGERSGQQPRTQSLESQVPTVVSTSKQALVTSFFEQANGGFYEGDGHAADVPLSTITSSGSNQRLISAYLVKYYSSGGQWQELDEAMHTLPTKGRMGLVQTVQVRSDLISPEHLERARQCAALLREHLPEHFTGPAELALMSYDGALWVLVDITLRMLKAHELYPAQGFPENYVIAPIVNGRPLPEHAQIRMCGNAVNPQVAAALVRANAPELASWSARELKQKVAA